MSFFLKWDFFQTSRPTRINGKLQSTAQTSVKCILQVTSQDTVLCSVTTPCLNSSTSVETGAVLKEESVHCMETCLSGLQCRINPLASHWVYICDLE